MSKPLWWKNSIKVIKDFTTDDSYMTFDVIENDVYFVYHVRVEGVYVMFEEIVSMDALSASDSIQKQLLDDLHDSFRTMLINYIDELDRSSIVGM